MRFTSVVWANDVIIVITNSARVKVLSALSCSKPQPGQVRLDLRIQPLRLGLLLAPLCCEPGPSSLQRVRRRPPAGPHRRTDRG